MALARPLAYSLLAMLAANQVVGHATFQDLWINGADYGGQCARIPLSNSPVTDVTSTNLRCNAGASAVAYKCDVGAGDIVTVEMHQVEPSQLHTFHGSSNAMSQQPGDRSCSNEAIGGRHYGPVQVYMSAVSDSATADGPDGWFKVFADTWASNPSGHSGDDDYWGTKDLNTCCGKMRIVIPDDIAPGDYLLRAEALALHVASSPEGAQFFMTCYQLSVSGGGIASPDIVDFPGAYAADDPGILVNIHAPMTHYVPPGPPIYSSGSTKSAGSDCEGCESTCAAGKGPTGAASGVSAAARARYMHRT